MDDKGLTPYQLSKESTVSEATLSRILNKDTKPHLKNLEKLSKYFQVRETWLLTGKKPMRSEIGSIVLNEEAFNDPKIVSDLFRLLIRHHAILKQNDLYPLYKKFIVEDAEIDASIEEARDLFKNKD